MVLIYVQRRDIRFIGQSMLKMKLPGKRKNKKTIEKIHRYSEEDVRERARLWQIICLGNP